MNLQFKYIYPIYYKNHVSLVMKRPLSFTTYSDKCSYILSLTDLNTFISI